MNYYYVLVTNPQKINQVDILGDLVSLIYSSKIVPLTNEQLTSLSLNKDYLKTVKTAVSAYLPKVPMYDIQSNLLFAIYWENVYSRIFYDHYRFVDRLFQSTLLNNVVTETDADNLRILEWYQMDVLEETYYKIFYRSFIVHAHITQCRRPSFNAGMAHISPYYTLNELNYLAYDWNISTKITLNEDQLINICQQIAHYDIPAQTLIDHQIYIYDKKAIGLVKYYSLYGSYYLNAYLRTTQYLLPQLVSYQNTFRNQNLENQIGIMARLIKNAPVFAQSHTVYRFVEKDYYLKHLKVGQIYVDSSFMSTTRNPFYYKQNYAFGYILIKIKLPANIRGVGLCIEAYSNFPSEEEIVLMPASRYRLDTVVDQSDRLQFDNEFKLTIKKKYEFTWIGSNYQLPRTNVPPTIVPTIMVKSLLETIQTTQLSIADRLMAFKNEHLNENNQFAAIIENVSYVFNLEAYDSSTIYKPFFYYETNNGIMITTSNPKYGNINLLMELGSQIHVNYYFRYSVTDESIVVDLNKQSWIEWLSMFAFIVGSRNVIIHSNYALPYHSNDTPLQKVTKTRYTYPQDAYIYLKYNRKLYTFDEITPRFDYAQFDYLTGICPFDFIKSEDKNELYRILQISAVKNMAQFYLYIVENYPKLIDTLTLKMQLVYEDNKNPFTHLEYNLDAWAYLYNHSYINQIPVISEQIPSFFQKLIVAHQIPKFENRLRYLIYPPTIA